MKIIKTKTKPIKYVLVDDDNFRDLSSISIYYFGQEDVVSKYRVVGWKNRKWINLNKFVANCYDANKIVLNVNGNPFDVRKINLIVVDRASYVKWKTPISATHKTIKWSIE